MQNSRDACLGLRATGSSYSCSLLPVPVSLANTAVAEKVSALLVNADLYHWTSTFQHMLLNI